MRLHLVLSNIVADLLLLLFSDNLHDLVSILRESGLGHGIKAHESCLTTGVYAVPTDDASDCGSAHDDRRNIIRPDDLGSIHERLLVPDLLVVCALCVKTMNRLSSGGGCEIRGRNHPSDGHGSEDHWGVVRDLTSELL